jgi:tight adherence protein B
LHDVDVAQFTAVIVVLFGLGGAIGFVIFGAFVPAVALGAVVASFPIASYRQRRRTRFVHAQDAWPAMLEELRILTNSVGMSVPQALFEVGRRGPVELRPGFEAAHREWLLSTDFARTVAVLKAQLADPTCDVAAETLLIAHELGGTDLDRRLAALVEDRLQEVRGRKDARARQAGARFARRFVLLVPVGMALAGMSLGTGRAAYRTATGQIAVVVAILLVIACWVWAGRFMRLPEEERVFAE